MNILKILDKFRKVPAFSLREVEQLYPGYHTHSEQLVQRNGANRYGSAPVLGSE
jgi:hypothetical protein